MAQILQSLNQEWSVVADSPTARRALMRWASRSDVFAGSRQLDEIVDVCSRGGRGREVLRALAERAAEDDLAARTLLQALLPGIACLAKRIGNDDPDGLDEMVSLAWERIRTYPTHRPGSVSANVLLDVRKWYLRARGVHDKDRLRPIVAEPAAEGSTPEEVVVGRVVVHELIAARERGMVSGPVLGTILRTRIDGESLVDLAAEQNLSVDALWRRRSRAEQRLRTLPLAG